MPTKRDCKVHNDGVRGRADALAKLNLQTKESPSVAQHMKAESLKDKMELYQEEKRRITSAEKLFTEMQKEIDNVRFTKQLRGQTMVKIIESIILD